ADSPDHPQNAYASAKCLAAEQSRILCERYGIKQCWPRLLSAYGPFDRPLTLIRSGLSACRRITPIDLTPCTQIWDYIHVSDVAEALYRIAERGWHGVKYPVASGVGTPLYTYIKTICEVTGNNILLEGVGKKEYQPSQVMYLSGDISLTASHTGFAPKMTFQRGIKQLWRMGGIDHE
ncbi:MAG: NAD-dependent epimerase/dehydratase family protein, partial [Lawsonibacter sp.]|nr:NAD-dependent epimerase/dehydratase family protein [Lawsonibacter sp.]